MKKAAILAAGEGSRLKEISPFKPIVKIHGKALFELTLDNLQFDNFDKIAVIFNEDEKVMDLSLLPGLKKLSIDYFFKTTLSSMHSLFEVFKRLEVKPEEHIFISMVDSIIRPQEMSLFHEFCKTLSSNESAIIVTPHIEDEKPLTLKIDSEGYVQEFQCPIESDTLVTSGVYYLSGTTMPLLTQKIESGQTKMRNFLMDLVLGQHKIKVFKINKTLDIDRPEDIASAEKFLKE